MKRLAQSTGEIVSQDNASDSADKVIRSAILVHAGPDDSEIEFLSGDGPIKFDAARIKRIVENHNQHLAKLAADYGGEDKIPMGAYPPLLDQHEGDSNDRIVGRLTGKLNFEVRDVPKVGKNVACAVAEGITFLGKETVERVKDGRIYHLSIGINEESDTLGETSTVIEPAAPGAMLLRKGETKPVIKGEQKMSKKQMKANTAKMTELASIKESLSKLSANLVSNKETLKLAQRKSEINKRLSGLMQSGKLTPAEFKKLDLVKLAKMDEESAKTALEIMESREPVINPKQYGSTDAVGAADMAKQLEKRQLKNLKSEISKDFKRMTGKALSMEDADEDHGKDKEMAGGNKEMPVAPGKDEHAVPEQAGDEKQLAALWGKHCEAVEKHMADGNMEEVKKAHEEMKAHMSKFGMKHMAFGDVKSEDEEKAMAGVQGQVDELNTQLARLAGLVSELMSAEKEEGHDLSAVEEEKEKPAEEKSA